jgi:putative ABC transport system permease protein
MWNDLKLAFRQLRLNRAFALIAIATVALGIGANTAIFTVMNTIMLRPLPYKNPDQLAAIHRTSPQSQNWPHAVADFADFRAENSIFEKICAYNFGSVSLANPGEPADSVRALSCTADFFSVMGTPASLGRTFAPEEDQPGRDKVVVISHTFWMHRFGSDRNIIGKIVRVDGQPVQIIGVMPASFEVWQLWSPIEIWKPLAFSAESLQDRSNHYIRVCGRLKPGVTVTQADRQMKVIASRLEKTYPESNAKTSLRVAPLKEQIGDQSSRRFAWLMLGLTIFVLMIACVNLANLQLARAAARGRELAVRLALGASRFRLMRQLLIESLAIAALGGATGIFISMWLADFLGKKLDRWSPSGVAMPLDWRVLTFALLCAVFTGLLFGIGPAWSASRSNMNETLKAGSRGSTTDRSQNFFRHALIISQVSLALVLLTGSALFTSGLRKFVQLNSGWNTDNLLVGWMPASSKFDNERQFIKTLEDRLRVIPGVRSVSISSSMPIWSFGTSRYGVPDNLTPNLARSRSSWPKASRPLTSKRWASL